MGSTNRCYSFSKKIFTPIHGYCNARDYNNVVQLTEEDDTVYGMFGDHQIRHILAPQASQAQEILGDDLCRWIRQRYHWYYEHFTA